MACAEYNELTKNVELVLERIAEIARKQRYALDTGNRAEFTRLDRELELALGEKERAIGAMTQHGRDHGCA